MAGFKTHGLKTNDPTGLVKPIEQVGETIIGHKTNAPKTSGDSSSPDDYTASMEALGQSELQQYKDIQSGKISGITPEQQAQIDRQTTAEQAQVRQAMANAGLTESTTRLSGEAGVLRDKIAAQEATTQATEKEHFDAAVKALGLGEQSSAVLAAMSSADRQQAMAIYADALGTGAMIAGRGYKSVVSEYTGDAVISNSTTGGSDLSSEPIA